MSSRNTTPRSIPTWSRRNHAQTARCDTDAIPTILSRDRGHSPIPILLLLLSLLALHSLVPVNAMAVGSEGASSTKQLLKQTHYYPTQYSEEIKNYPKLMDTHSPKQETGPSPEAIVDSAGNPIKSALRKGNQDDRVLDPNRKVRFSDVVQEDGVPVDFTGNPIKGALGRGNQEDRVLDPNRKVAFADTVQEDGVNTPLTPSQADRSTQGSSPVFVQTTHTTNNANFPTNNDHILPSGQTRFTAPPPTIVSRPSQQLKTTERGGKEEGVLFHADEHLPPVPMSFQDFPLPSGMDRTPAEYRKYLIKIGALGSLALGTGVAVGVGIADHNEAKYAKGAPRG